MTTFAKEANKTISEKVTLITIESAKPAKIFSLYSGSIYYRDVDLFVSSVKQGLNQLTQVYSIGSVVAGSFYYSINEKRLYLRTVGSVNPKTVEIIIFHKHFFSNRPTILPHDLSSGDAVEWLPLVNSIGSIGQQLDDLATGIVLESSSSIDLINQGYFDELYDTHIWENKSVKFYAWFNGLATTEAKLIFEGIIESKDFALDKITFKVKDFIFRLRDQLTHTLFSQADGNVSDAILGTPKRRIYGQVKQVKCIGTDLLLDGYLATGIVSIDTSLTNLAGTAQATYISNDISGTLSGNAGTRTINGSGTNFLSTVSPNQKIKITNGLATYTYTVFSITSNTLLTVTSDISVTFASFTAKNSSVGNNKVYGVGTSFKSQIQQGSQVRFTNGTLSQDYKIEYVDSDTELTLSEFITSSFNAYSIINLEEKNNRLVGIGTQFITQLSVGDTVKLIINGQEIKSRVDSINSDTSALLNDSIVGSVLNEQFYVIPEISYYKNNRTFNIAGHKLREPTTTITAINANNRFILASTLDMFAGDKLLINGKFSTIRRISGNELVTETEITPLPVVGDTVKKLPIQNVFFDFQEMIYERDWTYQNTTESKIIFTSSAEFNVSKEKLFGVSLQFTNGSRSVTTSSVADFRSILSARDYIKKNSIVSGESDWYEIIDVREQEIVLRYPFTGSTETTPALYKDVAYITDSSLITCNCLGMERAGLWIKTPSDAVRDLLLNDAAFPSVNETSFVQAKADCDYILSVVSPADIGSKAESIRDVITKINESVFGSLYGSSSTNVSYSVLNSTKPEQANIVYDDDIISFDASSSGTFYNSITLNYRPFTDQSSGSRTNEVYEFSSGFTDKYIGVKNTLEKTVYLYEEDKAIIIAQRLAFFNQLSITKVTVKGKMSFFLNEVNDKVMLSLDRLFKRLGGSSKKKYAMITGIKRSQYDVEVTLSDLGNVYNRVPSIAPNTASSYAAASEDEKIQWGYICDNDSLTPDASSEENLLNNVIG
jgi:hypothetical protein